MEKPLISVVIPVWNRKKELIRAINSINTQDYQNIETIIIDNNSTDGTREYLNKLKNIKKIYLDKNQGSSIGRNIGIKKALGKYIFFIDSDALLHKKDTLSKAIQIMEDNPQIGAISFVTYSDKKEHKIYTSGTYLDWKAHTTEKSHLPLKQRTTDIDYVSSCISLNRKKALESIGGFDPYFFFFAEDIDLGMRLKKAGWTIIADPEIKGLHLMSKKGKLQNIMNLRMIKAKNKIILKNFSTKGILIYYKRTIGEILRNIIKLLLIYQMPKARLRKNKKDFLDKTFIHKPSLLTKIYLNLPKKTRNRYINFMNKYTKKKVNKRKIPGNWFLFITNKCNSRCKHCFYWKELNDNQKEIKLSQYKKMILSVKGQIESINLTGGEPFLRKDLVDLCHLFSKKSQIKHITIPTNGLLPAHIQDITQKILEKIRKDIKLHIAVSLEGNETLNDEIRGIKDAYKKSIKTLKKLRNLTQKEKNLEISITTTISKFNLKDIIKFADKMKQTLNIYHRFILIRSVSNSVFKVPPHLLSGFDTPSKYTILPTIKELESIYQELTKKGHLQGRHKTLFKIGIQTLKEKKAPTPCLVGKLDLICYPNAEIAFCELTKPFDNLNRTNFNVPKIWNSKKANKIRKLLKNCACTHSCSIGSNLTCNIKERIKEELEL